MTTRLRPLTADEHQMLERLILSPTAATRVVTRARIVWYASRGYDVSTIATRLHLRPGTVRTWLHRFKNQGLAGLQDAGRRRGARPGGRAVLPEPQPHQLDLPFEP
jgi:DNA-directed RNA polymerase specialized sigma24 family protein